VNCDPIARWYRWLEYAGFGSALQRRRVAFLREAANAQRVLVLGDGDGRFLERLLENNRAASIDYVDLSGRMLELARARCLSERVKFHQADALKFPLSEYDLICTHFFLDCLNKNEMTELIERVARASRPGARWIVSEFREPAAWARAIVKMLYFFFRTATALHTRELVDHRPLLAKAGFTMSRCESARHGLLVSELWVLAAEAR
jgi:ubiquinone/menaquinone biosynthesis C-methylase UbiE